MVDIVYDAVLGAVNLGQVTNSSFDEGLEVLTARMSGATLPSDHFIGKGAPKAELTNVDIAGFLTAFGVAGGRITDGTTVRIPWHKRASGSTFAGGSSNPQVAGNTSCPVQLLPKSIHAPRNGTPTAQGDVIFLSADGKTIPHIVSVNNSLPSQVYNAMYGLGPVYLNGVQIPTHIGYTLNFGVVLSELEYFDGSVYPTDVFIETEDPSIEIMVEDFDQFASYTGGQAITSITAYLQKRLTGTTYVAAGTAQHIKFTLTGGILIPKALSAADTKHGNASIHVSGNSLTTSIASTIP